MTPELKDGKPPSKGTRIRDWIELFQIFQDRDELTPHHNAELQGYFSQTQNQGEGYLIYYLEDIGSFWLNYNENSYENDVAAHGLIETTEQISEITSIDTITPETGLKDQMTVFGDTNYLNPSTPAGRYTEEEDLITELRCEVQIPRDYDREKVQNTINTGTAILNWLRDSLCIDHPNYKGLVDRL